MYKGKFVSAVILGGGSSTRMGRDKITADLCGKAVISYSIEAFSDIADEIIIASAKPEKIEAVISDRDFGVPVKVVLGGRTRAYSAKNAACACNQACDIISIHDGARPLIDREAILTALDAAIEHGAAVVSTMLKDTVKRVNDSDEVLDTPNREEMRAVQTPQIFDYKLYMSAVNSCNLDIVTDDAGLIEQYGHKVILTEGSPRNIKLTTPEDFLTARAFLTEGKPLMKIGTGYDVHRLIEGRPLILCGEEIPSKDNLGLLGHSDADVAVHALMDALLGALALGDIGRHFPDNDDKYKGISSMLLLKRVMELVAEKGYRVGNLDITIIAEKPKLAKFIPKMRENLSAAVGIPIDCVSVKATTEEGLGLAGQGIGANATVLIF